MQFLGKSSIFREWHVNKRDIQFIRDQPEERLLKTRVLLFFFLWGLLGIGGFRVAMGSDALLGRVKEAQDHRVFGGRSGKYALYNLTRF